MNIILLVGPSGSGKDTLLRSARKHFGGSGRVGFVRRYITRPPDNNEDNYYIDPITFTFLAERKFFLSTWQAHTHFYGIASHSVFDLEHRDALICSISRSAIDDFSSRCDNIYTILITAKEEVLRQRLIQRGRENITAIEKRLERAKMPVEADNLITFDNSCALECSIASFHALLEEICSRTPCKVS